MLQGQVLRAKKREPPLPCVDEAAAAKTAAGDGVSERLFGVPFPGRGKPYRTAPQCFRERRKDLERAIGHEFIAFRRAGDAHDLTADRDPFVGFCGSNHINRSFLCNAPKQSYTLRQYPATSLVQRDPLRFGWRTEKERIEDAFASSAVSKAHAMAAPPPSQGYMYVKEDPAQFVDPSSRFRQHHNTSSARQKEPRGRFLLAELPFSNPGGTDLLARKRAMSKEITPVAPAAGRPSTTPAPSTVAVAKRRGFCLY